MAECLLADGTVVSDYVTPLSNLLQSRETAFLTSTGLRGGFSRSASNPSSDNVFKFKYLF